MLPHHEGPEPGYIACVCVLVTQSRVSAIVAFPHTSFPSPMDMPCKPPRQRPRHGPGWPRGAAGSAGGAPARPEVAWRLGGGICAYGGGGALGDVLLDAGQRPPLGDRPARATAAGSAWRRWPGRRGLVDGRQQRPRRCSVAEGPLGPDLGLDLDQGGSDPGLTGPSAASGRRPPLAVEGCDPLRLAATAAHLLPGSVPG